MLLMSCAASGVVRMSIRDRNMYIFFDIFVLIFVWVSVAKLTKILSKKAAAGQKKSAGDSPKYISRVIKKEFF
jgi:hypothetical protein